MNTRQIKAGAALSYAAIALHVVTGLFYTPWMVGTLGKSQYGLYTLANSLIALFLVDFGLGTAAGKYLSQYRAEGDRPRAEQFLGVIWRLYLLLDAMILTLLVVVFFLLGRIFAGLTAIQLQQLRVVYVILAVFHILHFPFGAVDGMLTAYGRFPFLKVTDLLYRLYSVGFAVVVLRAGYGLYALAAVHAAAGLLVLGIKYAFVRKNIPLKANLRSSGWRLCRELVTFSAWITLDSLAARLVFQITPSILGITASSGAIAVFGIVSTVEGYAYTITTAINGMFLPTVSRIVFSRPSQADLNSLFLRVGKFQALLNGLILAGFAVAGKDFITLWMGEDYADAYWGILLVLVPGLFYNALQIANTALVVTGKVKLTAMVSLITGLVNICLSFPLSRRFGVIGACISISTAYLVRALLLNLLCRRELSVDIPVFVKECYWKGAIPVLVTVGCGGILNRYVPDGGWAVFLLKSAAALGIYLLSALGLALNKGQRQTLLRWLKP